MADQLPTREMMQEKAETLRKDETMYQESCYIHFKEKVTEVIKEVSKLPLRMICVDGSWRSMRGYTTIDDFPYNHRIQARCCEKFNQEKLTDITVYPKKNDNNGIIIRWEDRPPHPSS